LKAALAEHPRHPLVLLLLAWCWEHEQTIASREQYLQWLRDAASDVPGPSRFIAQGNFLSLQPGERYEILARQPAESRSGEDHEQFARAAMAASLLPKALEHAEAALAASQGLPETLRRDRLRIEILLRLGQRERAAKEAWSRGTRPDTPPTERAELAMLLARYEVSDTAERLFEAALGVKDLLPATRRGLLHRRAEVQSGLARWRSLLEAATLASPSHPDRTTESSQVLNELTAPADAQAAAVLAREVKDVVLRAGLLLRQAELAIDSKVAADLIWQVREMGRLPVDRYEWACRTWNGVGQPEHVIELLEERLRRGRRLSDSELVELAVAYRQANRPVDAKRAETTARLPKPNQLAPQGMGGGMF
jgi:tetratricopeptide (TPR) repeat protein